MEHVPYLALWLVNPDIIDGVGSPDQFLFTHETYFGCHQETYLESVAEVFAPTPQKYNPVKVHWGYQDSGAVDVSDCPQDKYPFFKTLKFVCRDNWLQEKNLKFVKEAMSRRGKTAFSISRNGVCWGNTLKECCPAFTLPSISRDMVCPAAVTRILHLLLKLAQRRANTSFHPRERQAIPSLHKKLNLNLKKSEVWILKVLGNLLKWHDNYFDLKPELQCLHRETLLQTQTVNAWPLASRWFTPHKNCLWVKAIAALVLQVKQTLGLKEEKINICKWPLKWGDCSFWFSLRIFTSTSLLFLNLSKKKKDQPPLSPRRCFKRSFYPASMNVERNYKERKPKRVFLGL